MATPPDLHTGTSFTLKLGNDLARYLAAADVLGRLHITQHYKSRLRRPIPRLNTMAAISAFADATPGPFLIQSGNLVAPVHAISFLRNLTPVTRRLFDGLEQRYQAQAFTVSFITDTRLIGQIQDQVTAAVGTGSTLPEFESAIADITSEANIQSLTDWHVETVFRTNIQTAYSTGRLEQMRDPDVTEFFPYWQYETVGDDRVRDNHAEMNGFIARFDDPVWKLWWPPAGYNCRCSTIPIMEEDLPGSMSVDEANSSGLARVRAMPDEGFGGLGGIV